MKTPKEMAREIWNFSNESREWHEFRDVISAILTAWRDEATENAIAYAMGSIGASMEMAIDVCQVYRITEGHERNCSETVINPAASIVSHIDPDMSHNVDSVSRVRHNQAPESDELEDYIDWTRGSNHDSYECMMPTRADCIDILRSILARSTRADGCNTCRWENGGEGDEEHCSNCLVRPEPIHSNWEPKPTDSPKDN